MDTLIQLTTISTLTACLLLSINNGAFAARQASKSTSNLTQGRSTGTASDTSWLANYATYEPDPNGNPKSDGTGTR